MGPPPVPPQRKISIAVPSKKRARDVDDILGDEVDAIQAPVTTKIKTKVKDEAQALSGLSSNATKKARRSPEKQAAPSKKRDRELSAYLDDPIDSLPPAPVASSVPVPVAPANPFQGQPVPSQSAVSLPFRQKRAKQLITLLQKEPSAQIVCLTRHVVIDVESADVFSSCGLSTRCWMDVLRESSLALQKGGSDQTQILYRDQETTRFWYDRQEGRWQRGQEILYDAAVW